MEAVKWVKLTTDMFDNRKIKYLRTLPEGNNIVLIWVMLLTMAGRCNSGGMIFLAENVPYTTKMLADELGFEENTVCLALQAFERLGMVRFDDFLCIDGWDEYQNADALAKIREKERLRKQRQREKAKLQIPDVTGRSRDSHGTSHGTLLLERENREIDIDSKKKNTKKKSFVPPTREEVREYAKTRGNPVDPDLFFDYFQEGNWIDSKGNPVLGWKQKYITWEKYGKESGKQQTNDYKRVARSPDEYSKDDFISGL